MRAVILLGWSGVPPCGWYLRLNLRFRVALLDQIQKSESEENKKKMTLKTGFGFEARWGWGGVVALSLEDRRVGYYARGVGGRSAR